MSGGTLWITDAAWTVIAGTAASSTVRETGGPLLGYINAEHVIVVHAYGPGRGARRHRHSFVADSADTQQIIDQVAAASGGRDGFLGSWHTHPAGAARPSPQDVATVRDIATQPQVLLPRPVALIVATRPWRRPSRRTHTAAAWRLDPAGTLRPLRSERIGNLTA